MEIFLTILECKFKINLGYRMGYRMGYRNNLKMVVKMMGLQLENKVIIVTGAAMGIGLALSKGCAVAGATVIMADINKEKLAESVENIKELGLHCEGVYLDICDATMIQSEFNNIFNKYGHIDGLVNNAGIASKVKFIESTIKDFDKVLNVNIRAVYLCCKYVSEHMVRQKSGSIVNIASVAARNGGGLMGTSLYAASKGAVISFTKGIARELAPYNVHVNAIAPGSIDTPMTTVGRDPEEYAATIKKMPLGRRGKPEEIIGPTLLLLSDAGSFMVGVTLDVNGGIYMY